MKGAQPAGSICLILLACWMASGCAGFQRGGKPPDFSGAWSVAAPNAPFDLVVFRNGQCVRVSPSTNPLEKGSRGLIQPAAQGAILIFEDGDAATLRASRNLVEWTDGISKRGRRTSAIPLSNDLSRYVGLWRLNPEPDGRYLYVQLHSDGSARDSLGSAVGRWESLDDGVLCSWPDGWRDWITPDGDKYIKRSWAPGSPLSNDPVDTSIAMRVGEKPFEFAP